jgi:hypothetical protein
MRKSIAIKLNKNADLREELKAKRDELINECVTLAVAHNKSMDVNERDLLIQQMRDRASIVNWLEGLL